MEYSECKVISGVIKITFDEDYTAGTVIEVYLDRALRLNLESGEKLDSVTISFVWVSVTVATNSV